MMKRFFRFSLKACILSVLAFPCFLGARPSSIEMTLLQTTAEIYHMPADAYEDLADGYATRGEGYFFSGCYEEALTDFEQAYTHAQNISCPVEASLPKLRSLLGQYFSYGNVERDEMLPPLAEKVHTLLSKMDCPYASRPPILLCAKDDVPISGPINISIEECQQRARGTASSCRALFKQSKPKVREEADKVIAFLEVHAVKCCGGGVPWKTCLQRLINKWSKWTRDPLPTDPRDLDVLD